MNNKNHYSFLAIGKTQASSNFKRYIGVGSSFVLAVNPSKKELDELRGFESQGEPEYVKDTDDGKEVHIHFVVKTDPATNNGIEMTNLMMFTLRNKPAYSNDQTSVQVIDKYGNSTWAPVEDAKAHKQLPPSAKVDQASYRMAAVGEADLVAFLKTYLNVPASLKYVNSEWVKSEEAETGVFELEHIKDYFKGDFSELQEALKLQPNNKIKLLYGVKTTDGNKPYQAVAAREGLFTFNNAGIKSLERMEKRLAGMKARGSFANTDFKVCELQEWTVQPTNLETPAAQDTPEDTPAFPDNLENFWDQ